MKLLTITILVLYAVISSAEENPRGNLIQVCGDELAKAMKRVCVDGDLEYLNQPQIQHNHKHDHDHNHHQHGREHKHDHQHFHHHDQHDHEHNHQHDHEQHQHDHDHHHDWKQSEKELPANLADECCLKPCHVKDFVTFCPNKIQ